MSPAEMLETLNAQHDSAEVIRGSVGNGYVARWGRAENGSRHGLLSSLCGHGDTADEAMRELWAAVTGASRIVIGAYSPERREIMWCDMTNRFIPYGSRRDASHLLSR